MKIFVHDYPGHSFQPFLSRWLALQGHQVAHSYFRGFQAPQGALTVQPADPQTFSIRPIELDRPFEKYSFGRRFLQERQYGRRLSSMIQDFRPDIVLAGNAPLDIQNASYKTARSLGVPFIFWHQDVYSSAIDKTLRQRLPVVGSIIGSRYIGLERRLLRASDHVVTITPDFLPLLARWGVRPDKVTVIENWAPIGSFGNVEKRNAWSVEKGLAGDPVALYAGTLGLKHNPAMLLKAARQLKQRVPAAKMVVISEGPGTDWLRGNAGSLDNLRFYPFQGFERMPEVLGTADVLLAILEPDAGIFSVPSKVLTYLCAGRAIVAAIPSENLAARILNENKAGIVVDPRSESQFGAAIVELLADPSRRETIAKNSLEYARKNFDIGTIGPRFLSIIERLT